MVKVALFRKIGGFTLSHEAVVELAKRKGWNLWWKMEDFWYQYYEGMTVEQIKDEHGKGLLGGILNYYIDYVDEYWREGSWNLPYVSHEHRTDKDLIDIIEEMGERAGYELQVIEVPDDVDWIIEEDGETGYEWVAETHRTW